MPHTHCIMVPTSIMPQMLYTSHVHACSQTPTLMLTARGAQPSQGLADHKALTARVLVCHARGEPRMRGVADVGVSSDPRLGTTIAARICGGGVAATPASDAAPSHGAAQEAASFRGFCRAGTPASQCRGKTSAHATRARFSVSGAKGTASTPNFGATLSDAQPTGAWCLYRQTPARATRFGSPDGLLQMAYLFQPPWAERMGLALQAGPAQGRA